MFSQISMATAAIIVTCVSVLSIALVAVVGKFLKPDPQPRLYSSVEEFMEKEAAETSHE